jgi:hypothetical protein
VTTFNIAAERTSCRTGLPGAIALPAFTDWLKHEKGKEANNSRNMAVGNRDIGFYLVIAEDLFCVLSLALSAPSAQSLNGFTSSPLGL